MSENLVNSPAEPADASARGALLPVAVSLLIVSSLWIVLSLFGIVFFVAQALSADADLDNRRLNLTYAGYLCAEIFYCGLLITGAFSMIGRGSYAWAIATSCLACVPCLSPIYVVGIPIGIWALVVLRRPAVKAAFRRP